MSDFRLHSQLSNLIRINLGVTGLAYNTASLKISAIADNQNGSSFVYTSGSTIENVTSTIGQYQTPSASNCRFIAVDATNNPGLYEIHFLNAVFAVADAKYVDICVSGAAGLPTTGVHYRNQLNAPVSTELLNGSATAASNLRISADVMVPGAVDDAAFTPTTTEFETSDIVLASAEALKDRRILWVSGNLIKQVCGIADYALISGKGHFTITAVTEAPADGDNFIVV